MGIEGKKEVDVKSRLALPARQRSREADLSSDEISG
jgi:DNA-binding transcriptional regulator/RsmH inhibitor MraZ